MAFKTHYIILAVLLLFISCKETEKHEFTNALINETSPYLLQHAHNPVNWYPWNNETLELAKKENKLILISIGYAACHWCHVMEHESFEDKEVAKIMNENFINIKIDREERPDVDQIYMTAVQLMTGSGGWPLNCIALPNGKPVWGGTYFSKEDWTSSINQISDIYKKEPRKLTDFAEKLTNGIHESSLIKENTSKQNYNIDSLKTYVNKWQTNFDTALGGMDVAPKFPMPNNYQFLLRYAHQTKDKELTTYINTTLEKMALGGLNDQVGGGFSRYSTDKKWHIPHFEKMLYDNGQLVSLYADAYLATKNSLYKETVYQTLAFVEHELYNNNGGFYSSLDADSLTEEKELEEGAFYVWKKEELSKIIITDFDVFSDYFSINEHGFWEEEKFHFIRKISDIEFAKKHSLTIETLKTKVTNWRKILIKERAKKERPRLDDKILTSWNALLLKGYVDAYRVFNDLHFLEMAIKNASFLKNNVLKKDGSLYRNYKNGDASINGYLEDYATLINAYITLYQSTFNGEWLSLAKELTDYTLTHFFDEKSQLFYFTSDEDPALIARKTDIEDNVIASSNSIMAKNLFLMGHFYDNENYASISKKMLHNVTSYISKYPSAYANWLDLYLNYAEKFYEVAISGEDSLEKLKEINSVYIPNKLYCGSTKENDLPLLVNRFVEDETYIYICVNKVCNLPLTESDKAISSLIEGK